MHPIRPLVRLTTIPVDDLDIDMDVNAMDMGTPMGRSPIDDEKLWAQTARQKGVTREKRRGNDDAEDGLKSLET